jgi:HSP20 family protein
VAPAGGAVSGAQSVSRAAASRQPIVDVFEEDSDIVVIAELPGASEQDIACTVTGMSLRIETTGAHAYAKDVVLPGRTDPAALSYRCQNGILEVRLRRVSTPS